MFYNRDCKTYLLGHHLQFVYIIYILRYTIYSFNTLILQR